MVLLPISESVSIDLIPSAPPIANSIGSEISDAIIEGLAPMYFVEITTSGGCNFGIFVLSSKARGQIYRVITKNAQAGLYI